MEVAVAETLLRVNKGTYDRDLDAADKRLTSFGSGSQSAFQRLGASFTSIGTAMTIGITAPLALLAKQILTVGVDYEKSMNVFQAVTRASGTEMARAGDLAKKLGADMSLPATSAGNAAKAMTELAKGGLDASQAMDAVKGTLQLAAAATIEEGQAATITANALNAFGLAASEAGRVSDLLAAAANASSAEITDVAASMQQSSASAAALKIPIEDLVTSIGLMANAGIKGSDAGTSMKTMFAALTPKTTEAANAMKQLGIDAFDAQGKFVGMEAIIAQAAPALAKLTDEQKAFTIEAAFGSDAQRAANIVLGAGVEKFNEMSGAVNRSGAAAELAAAKAKGLGGAWDGLKSQLETVALVIFEKVGPGLEKMVRWFADIVAAIGNVNPRLLEMGAVAAAVFGASGPILVGLGAVTKALAGLGAAGGPIALAIAGIAALAAAYATNFGQMQRTLDDFVANWTKSTTQTGKDWETFGSIVVKGIILLTQGFDTIITATQVMALGLVAAAKMAAQAIMGNLAGAAQSWKDYAKHADEILVEHHQRALARASEMEGVGAAHAKAVSRGFEKNLDLKGPAQKELQQMRGPLQVLAEQTGSGIGRSMMFGWDSQTRRSPFFIIHDLESAFLFATALAPKFEKVGKDIGKSLVTGWKGNLDSLLDTLRDWSNAIGIRLEITKEMWAKLRKDVQNILKQKAADHKQLQDTLDQIYIGIAAFPQKAADAMKKAYDQMTRNTKDAAIEIKSHIKDLAGDELPIRMGVNAKLILETLEKEKQAREQHIREVIQITNRGLEHEKTLAREREQIITDSFKKIADLAGKGVADLVKVVLKGMGELTDKSAAQAAKWTEGILEVIDGLPGKMGDKLRRVTSTILEWINGIDRVLKGLHKIFDAVPDGLGKALESVIGIFKKVLSTDLPQATVVGQKAIDILASTVKGATQSITGLGAEGKGAGSGIGNAFKIAAGAVGSFATGLAIASVAAGSFKTELMGVLAAAAAGFAQGGVLGAAVAAFAAGFKSESKILRFATGGLISLFFGGPSDEEKAAQERAKQQAIDQAKITAQQAIQAIEQTKQSILDTVAKARDIIESIRFHTTIGKEPLRQFFADLHRFMQKLAAEALTWKGFADKEIQKAIKHISGAVDLVAKIPAAFAAIATHFKVPDVQFGIFFDDLDKFWDLFSARAEDWSKKAAKKISKIAKFLAPAVDLISPLTEGFKSLFDLKRAPAEAFDIIDEYLNTITTRIGALADKMDKGVLKAIEFFSSKAAPAIDLWKATIDLVKSAVDVKTPSPADIEAIYSSLTVFINRTVQMSKEVNTEGLLLAAKIAESIIPIANGLKSWVEVSVLARDYTAIGAEVFEAIAGDLRSVLSWQDEMLGLADEGLAKGLTFEDRMAEWGASIARGLSALASIAGGSFNVTTNALTAGTNFNALATAPAGGGSNFSSGSSSAPVSYHTHYHGTVIQDQQHRELLLRDMVALQRSGRLRSGTVEE